MRSTRNRCYDFKLHYRYNIFKLVRRKIEYMTQHPHKSGKNRKNKCSKIMIMYNNDIETLKYGTDVYIAVRVFVQKTTCLHLKAPHLYIK